MDRQFTCQAAFGRCRVCLVISNLILLLGPGQASAQPLGSADAIAGAQAPQHVAAERPEQKKSDHDLSDVFDPSKAAATSKALRDQQDGGRFVGFDFYSDPLGAMKPGMTFDDFYKAGVEGKPKVTARQRKLLGKPIQARTEA